MDVRIDGKTIGLGDQNELAVGGEATVYLTADGVVKIWKTADHPDLDATGREDAIRRISEHQRKMPLIVGEYSSRLGAGMNRVVVPRQLAMAPRGNRIVGYRMDIVRNGISLDRLGRPDFRQNGSVSNNVIMRLFLDIDRTIRLIHSVGVIVGDCNDLNILAVLGDPVTAHFIDVDSWQYPGFPCRMFTPDFVDPVICDPSLDTPRLVYDPEDPDSDSLVFHNQASDVFALNTMLFRCLLLVDPYGGVYRPPKGQPRVAPRARKMARISVMHDGVGMPASVMHYGVLPDELIDHFLGVFERDVRGEFPTDIVSAVRWTRCSNCGIEHARNRCPNCDRISGLVREIQRGNITITTMFQASGIVTARSHAGTLHYLYGEGGGLYREGGAIVLMGNTRPQMRFRIGPRSTYIGMGNSVHEIMVDGSRRSYSVDVVMGLPAFDANSRNLFWSNANTLYRNNDLGGSEAIGSILSGRTLFWVGERFGFGFYRIGEAQRGFVFDVDGAGLRDVPDLPRIRGHLLDAKAFLSRDRCWFLFSIRDGGRTINRCVVIGSDGSVHATVVGEAGDGSWIGTIRGKVVASRGMFSVSDDGLVHVVDSQGTIEVASRFTDTEGLIQSDCDLQPGAKGTLYVIDRQRVMLLQLRGER